MKQEKSNNCKTEKQTIDMGELLKQANGSFVSQAMGRLATKRKNLLLTTLGNPVQVERIAAAQIVHLLEGWLNLSASLSCLVRNEISQAKHLAYYGELRAVLSIIASSGMILVKNKLFYVDGDGNINDINGVQTHQIAWEFWINWIRTSDAKKFITQNIKLSEDLTLADITESVITLSSANERLVTAWGHDLLKIASDDHVARNKASYGISLAIDDVSKKIRSYVPFLEKIWSLLMPYSNSIIRFDSAMIKYIVRSVASGLEDSENSNISPSLKFEKNLAALVDKISSNSERLLSSFKDETDLDIFNYAIDEKDAPENMISRCLIILRIATLAVLSNMRDQKRIEAWIRLWLKKIVFFNERQEYDVKDAILDYENVFTEGDMDKLTKPVASLAWGLSL